MDKIKKFIDCYIPTEVCNLKCEYCYISHLENFNNKTIKIEKEPYFIRKALSKERLGGVCMLNFCAGGETLLANEIIPIVKELLEEGHYVMIVTNGTLTQRFEELSKFPKELLNRLFFKFSFHYLEFKRLNLLDKFISNVKMMQKAGASFTIEITPSDELIEYIDDVKEISLREFGALPHITVTRKENGEIPLYTNLSKEKYVETWSTFKSDLFDMKMKIFGEKRKEFCYAGDWSFVLNMATGEIKQCYRGITFQNIYENLDEPIKKLPVGNCCNEPHCFNGHAFLSFGDIPELDFPTFDELRNRSTSNGEWLSNTMKTFMKTRLRDSNKLYTKAEKRKINLRNKKHIVLNKIKFKIKKIIKK